jgi:hypothetical protein
MVILVKYTQDKGDELYKKSLLEDGSDLGPLHEAHAGAHLGILMVFVLKIALLIYFMIRFFGLNTFFNEVLVNENGWLYILVTAYAITALTRHLVKERVGRSHYLNIKKESGIQGIYNAVKSVFMNHEHVE